MTSGRARFVVVAVPAAIYFFSYFHRVAPAVVAADLMRAFGITAASLALLAAVYPYVFAGMALVAGSLADAVGPRWTLAAGGVAMAFGTALFGLAPTFGVAVAGRLVMGIGASVVLIAWLSLIAAWLRPEEFATAAGWTQTVGNVGGLAASTPLALLVEAAGWRETFVLIGSVTLLLAFVVVIVVRDRPEHAAPARRGAGSFGLVQLASGIVLDARWQGLAVQGARIYSAGAYRGLFTLCLAIAIGAALAAGLVNETRCRNISAGT